MYAPAVFIPLRELRSSWPVNVYMYLCQSRLTDLHLSVILISIDRIQKVLKIYPSDWKLPTLGIVGELELAPFS